MAVPCRADGSWAEDSETCGAKRSERRAGGERDQSLGQRVGNDGGAGAGVTVRPLRGRALRPAPVARWPGRTRRSCIGPGERREWRGLRAGRRGGLGPGQVWALWAGTFRAGEGEVPGAHRAVRRCTAGPPAISSAAIRSHTHRWHPPPPAPPPPPPALFLPRQRARTLARARAKRLSTRACTAGLEIIAARRGPPGARRSRAQHRSPDRRGPAAARGRSGRQCCGRGASAPVLSTCSMSPVPASPRPRPRTHRCTCNSPPTSQSSYLRQSSYQLRQSSYHPCANPANPPSLGLLSQSSYPPPPPLHT